MDDMRKKIEVEPFSVLTLISTLYIGISVFCGL